MILSDKQIQEEIDKGTILIEPYNPACLGTNSYDVHLGKYLATLEDIKLLPAEDSPLTIRAIGSVISLEVNVR